jgi:N-acyl-D-amino-acid deacylase
VKKIMQLPYMSFGSDAGAVAAEGETLESMTHPRTYGNFARLLGKYVRDEKVLSLEEAIRKLTSLPAENLKIAKRGMLSPGFYADVVIFDPNTIQDHATFEQPHQYSTGVTHVLVNGRQVLKDGEHTGAKPGKFVKGLGWKN